MKKPTFCDFAMGRVVIDFRNYTMEELKALRFLCHLIEPDCEEPAYSFDACYYVKPEYCRWYSGASHHLVRNQTCRATDIVLPFEVPA